MTQVQICSYFRNVLVPPKETSMQNFMDEGQSWKSQKIIWGKSAVWVVLGRPLLHFLQLVVVISHHQLFPLDSLRGNDNDPAEAVPCYTVCQWQRHPFFVIDRKATFFVLVQLAIHGWCWWWPWSTWCRWSCRSCTGKVCSWTPLSCSIFCWQILTSHSFSFTIIVKHCTFTKN